MNSLNPCKKDNYYDHSMSKAVDKEYRAFAKGDVRLGILRAGQARAQGMANIGIGIIAGSIGIASTTVFGAGCILGAVLTSPFLMSKKERDIPIACARGSVKAVIVAGKCVISIATCPFTQLIAPEAFYKPEEEEA